MVVFLSLPYSYTRCYCCCSRRDHAILTQLTLSLSLSLSSTCRRADQAQPPRGISHGHGLEGVLRRRVHSRGRRLPLLVARRPGALGSFGQPGVCVERNDERIKGYFHSCIVFVHCSDRPLHAFLLGVFASLKYGLVSSSATFGSSSVSFSIFTL